MKSYLTSKIERKFPDLAEIQRIAKKVLKKFPEKYKPFLNTLVVRVENYADILTLEKLNIYAKNDLLGLYQGTPLPYKKGTILTAVPDVVFLYRCPLIFHALETGESFGDLISQVIIHEIGYHFGFNQEEMEWINWEDLGGGGGRNRD